MKRLFLAWLGISLVSLAQAGTDAALVTFLQGGVVRVTPQGNLPVQAFVKLKVGDLLALQGDARLRIVYFGNGRQETWQGSGRIEIAVTESRATGLVAPDVRQLPLAVVKQISRAPTADGQERAGMIRLRAFATPEGLDALENNYRRLRMEADKDDINPELYRLSALFEMRAFEQLEQTLTEMNRAYPSRPEVGLLASLYKRAIKNSREAKQ